jgi:hypothetical protein
MQLRVMVSAERYEVRKPFIAQPAIGAVMQIGSFFATKAKLRQIAFGVGKFDLSPMIRFQVLGIGTEPKHLESTIQSFQPSCPLHFSRRVNSSSIALIQAAKIL